MALVLGAAACGAFGGSAPPGTPVATVGPPPGQSLTVAELRLVLIDNLGPRWYCDPDQFPVAVQSEQERAIERWPEMQAEGELFRAVATRLRIDVDGAVSNADKQAIYHVWKTAQSIPLEPNWRWPLPVRVRQ